MFTTILLYFKHGKRRENNFKKLEELVGVIARNVADIKGDMVTKKELKAELEVVERRLSAKIESADEKLETLEEIDVRDLQCRILVLEKDVKQIKNKNV